MPVIDVLRSATTVGAEVVDMVGEIGTVKVGAFADLIAVDGNPLKDIAVLAGQGEMIPFVMKGGVIIKRDGRPIFV
ncbi:MAG: amidohydrolase family protein [Hyphomicrobium sp.]